MALDMMELLKKIGPLPRTLACEATDQAFAILKEQLPDLKIGSVESGQKVWTWTVPKRWEVGRAYIKGVDSGKVIVDGDWHPMHVVNYSQPFTGTVSQEELKKHLFTDEKSPDAIPFVFKFYEDKWGFAVPHSWLSRFQDSQYEVVIESRFEEGVLNFGSLHLQGQSPETFVVCSDICHPTQVNDSLTGLAAAASVAEELGQRKNLKYSYLFLFVPETIGSISFFAKYPEMIKKSVGAIFTEMLGTPGAFVGQRSRKGETYWDTILEKVLMENSEENKIVPFLKSASNDEKVMDSPGVDIPSVAFSRYPYPEYHTSNDNIDLIDSTKLQEGRDLLAKYINWVEEDYIPVLSQPGPIFLSGYGLHPDWRSDPSLVPAWEGFIDVMYAIDGKKSMVELAQETGRSLEVVKYWCDGFLGKDLISKKLKVVKRDS